MPPAHARRGSTHQSVDEAAIVMLDPAKQRIVQQGTWTPKGVSARLVFGSCSDAGCSMDGSPKTNQDSFISAVPHPFGPTALFAVFDGHGAHGHLVSRQAMAEFGKLLHVQQQRQRDVGASLSAAYLEQDRSVGAAVDCSQSGTTAVTCLLRVDPATASIVCHTGWAGDSRAVLGCVRPDGQLAALDLTVDHKPDRPDEKARIERSGGRVEAVHDARGAPAGPPRVWYIAQVAPGLAMTRSIGDAVGAMVGVTAEPELSARVLQDEDALLVVASDGVWEFLTSQQVVALVSQLLRGKPITEEAAAAAAEQLCNHARKLWREEDLYVDDITATVIVIQQAPNPSRPRADSGGGAAGAGGPPTMVNDGRSAAAAAVAAPPGMTAPQQRHSIAGANGVGSDGGGGGLPYGAPPAPLNGKRGPRMSVTALGPHGKRGAVSGESAATIANAKGGGSAELVRHKKSSERMELILAAIQDPRHLIFQGMTEEARVLVAECMFMQHASAGQSVIRQGEQGDIVYIVESGRYEVFLEQSGETPVARYQKGDSFGELALMYSCARAATVKCVLPGILWGLDRISYRTIIQKTSDSINSSIMQMLRSVPVLKPLDAQQLSALSQTLQIVTVQPGASLLRGVPIDALYILQTGSLSVSHAGAPPFTVQPGAAIGEDAVAGDRPPTVPVTATAITRCVLARITRDSFSRNVGALQEVKELNFNETALARVAGLAALSIAERRQLARLMSRVRYGPGETIARAGGEIGQFHIVYRGRVLVQQPPGGGGGGGGVGASPGGRHGSYNGGRVAGGGGSGSGMAVAGGASAVVQEGEVFGEGALLRNEVAAATYVAGDGGVDCMVVGREAVQRVLGPLTAIIERERAKEARKAHARSVDYGKLKHGRIIGIGTFGVVRLVQDGGSAAPFALKSMLKQKVFEMGQAEHVTAECRLLAECDHPFIVQLVRTYETEYHIHLLLELTLGGELFSVLRAAPGGCFPERRCQFYGAMIVLAFEYLHDKQIIYRDLKPENLLFDADGYLKIVDFGFAKRVTDRTWTVCGTPEYMAPEIILNKGHDKAVDWWTLGILIYEMLVGFPPFEGADPMALYKTIVANDVRFPTKVAPQPQELVKRLLSSDPAARLGSLKGGADDVKRHGFFKKIVWHSLLLKKIDAPYKPAIGSDTDASNFESFDDPDKGRPIQRNTFPRATFDEFSRLTASYTAGR